MNNTYGSVRPSIVDVDNDVEIFYHYRPTRNSEDESFTSFKKISSASSMLSIAKFTDDNEETNDLRLPGMYNLSLPVSIFSQVGFYTIYIRPKEIKATIRDIGVLAAYTDINGIVIDMNEQNDQSSLFQSDSLNGYRIDYFEDDGDGLKRQDYYRIITGCNRCEPITQNLSSSNSNSNGYRFNSSGSLCFLTVTPNSSPSYKSGTTPFIGAPNQKIRISNTKFDPVMIEVEICRHDIETLNTAIDGNQIRSLDNGLLTTYNENGEVYSQKEFFTLKDNYTDSERYEVKKDRTGNIEFGPNYNSVMGN
jgi:hypothetical protein